ncbi:hypothetical protein ACWJJH_06240 [Endozoicomonadaceae bacterium StTr2]
MGTGPVTSGILSDITNLHNDASDIKDLYRELKLAPKRHNGRKVAFSPKLARKLIKKPLKRLQRPPLGRQRKITGIPGKNVTPKMKPSAQPQKQRPHSPLPKEPPRALLELQRQNEARAAATKGIESSVPQTNMSKLANELMDICQKIETPQLAAEFKQTLNSLSIKGLDSQEVRELQSMLVKKIKQMAANPELSDQITYSFVKKIAGEFVADEIDDARLKQLQRRYDALRRG